MTEGFAWSAERYGVFLDQRNRPLADLLSAIPPPPPGPAVDLGCGPGNSTEYLLRAFPGLQVSGLDSSADMIQAARQRLPAHPFAQADIAQWDAPGPFSVILANAVFHWLPDHARLLPRLAAKLAPGGTLAVQMPDNLEEPAHVLMREVAAAMPFAAAFAPALAARGALARPAQYLDWLRPCAGKVEIWRTTYHHVLDDAAAIAAWFEGSGLRPYLACLTPAQAVIYREAYIAALARAYPPLPTGGVLLPFPRLFLTATR